MDIEIKNKQYTQNVERWSRNRAVISGQDAIHAGGERYLPRIGAQNDAEYKAYKMRATFFNASSRTLDGLMGMVFRKPPVLDAPPSIQNDWQYNIDLAGTSLDELCRKIVSDDLITGRGGLLVEYPRAEIRDRTEEEINAEGLRPYLIYYPTESIWDWRVGAKGNKQVLTFLKLHYFTETPDGWATKETEHMKVYRFDEVVTVETWTKVEGKWELTEDPAPIIIGGRPADRIPFLFTAGINVEKSAMDDIISMNLSHYRTTADYENSAHWASVPTPVFIGDIVSPDGSPVTEIRLGSSTGINLGTGGNAMMLQAHLEEGLGKVLERKESYMAVLGARILAQEKKQAEAAETAAIHRAGENSVLASRANSLSQIIREALEIMLEYSGRPGEVGFNLNTDYLPMPMTAAELTATVSAWMNGAFTNTELFEALQAGEVIRYDKTYEEHEQETELEAEARKERSSRMLWE